jgi:GTPase SAR1 family protein
MSQGGNGGGQVVDEAVYDVSARATFDELVRWFREIETYCGEGVVKMVVGNKVDKASQTPTRQLIVADGAGVFETGDYV